MNLTTPLIALTFALMPQQPPPRTGAATASGTCNFASTGETGAVNITCGIGQEQGQKMLDILNNILANQLDSKVVMDKLEEILRAKNSAGTFVQQGQNGINIGPGASAPNAQVFNGTLTPAERAANKEKRDRISALMNVGLNLSNECFKHEAPWPGLEATINDWADQATKYLRTLDAGWSSSFNTARGLPMVYGDVPPAYVNGINFINARIDALKAILNTIPVQ